MYGTSFPPEEIKGFNFTDQTIRRAFIRKVYSILMVQLLVTLSFIALVFYHAPTRQYIAEHPMIFILALVAFLVSMCGLACCGDVRRKAPMNYILLAVFTLAESFLLAITASRYRSEEVIIAVGITAAVALGLTLFAFQTKYDFTMMGGALFVGVLILMIFGFVAMIFQTKVITLIYASLGAFMFSIYLIYDTQLMLGGKHSYAISPEEYIFAVLNLYLDIVQLFMHILTIIGALRD